MRKDASLNGNIVEDKAHSLSPSSSSQLGVRVRDIRKRRKWTQGELGKRTGLAVSTISKIENGQLSPTFETLMRLAEGLSLDIPDLLEREALPPALTRLSVTRRGHGEVHEMPHYNYRLLCSDLANKQMNPLIAELKAHSKKEFGPLFSHPGEELFLVLKGKVELHTEHYTTRYMGEGDCAYFDSTMGHACISVGEEDAVLFWVSTLRDTKVDWG
ncbi:MAG: XRE family transcriptional regulator [marine bacterium B5-7]|nr:MAG: XRE family transcriptional regulator [marine bacterium B5-7]